MTGPIPQHPTVTTVTLGLPITAAKLVNTTSPGGPITELVLTFTSGGTVTIPATRN